MYLRSPNSRLADLTLPLLNKIFLDINSSTRSRLRVEAQD